MAVRVFPEIGLTIPIDGAFTAQETKDGNTTKLKFNQAYVIDYYSMGNGGLKTVKIENMEEEYSSGGDFFVALEYDGDTFKVGSASFRKGGGSAEEENKIYIPICKTDNNGIKEMYVRENIHWMMLPKPSDKEKAGVVIFDKDGNTPGGKGKIKWLQFEDEEEINVVGGKKEKVQLIPTFECKDEEDPYG
jgi:hypothetical protein